MKPEGTRVVVHCDDKDKEQWHRKGGWSGLDVPDCHHRIPACSFPLFPGSCGQKRPTIAVELS